MTKTKEKVNVKAELTIAWGSRDKLWAEGDKLRAEGDKLWACKIIELIGNVTVQWTYVKTVEYNDFYRCELGNGMTFEP